MTDDSSASPFYAMSTILCTGTDRSAGGGGSSYTGPLGNAQTTPGANDGSGKITTSLR